MTSSLVVIVVRTDVRPGASQRPASFSFVARHMVEIIPLASVGICPQMRLGARRANAMHVGKFSAVGHVHGRIERCKTVVPFDPHVTDITLRIRAGIDNFTWHISSFEFATTLDLLTPIDDCLHRESKNCLVAVSQHGRCRLVLQGRRHRPCPYVNLNFLESASFVCRINCLDSLRIPKERERQFLLFIFIFLIVTDFLPFRESQ